MAEDVVSFLLHKLDDVLTRKLDLIQGVDIKILSLHNKLSLMRALLEDMDARRRDNKRIKVWIGQVRDVTFRAEDAIDRYIYEAQAGQRQFRTPMKAIVDRTNNLKIRYELGIEIEEIKQMLQDISASRSEFGIEPIPQFSRGEASSSSSTAPNRALVEETNVIGFDRHVTDVVGLLVGEERAGFAVPIVGMGGLGKTTLARRVYNDTKVNNYFQCKAWINVSQKYIRRDLLKAMLEEFSKPVKEKLEKMTDKEMEDELKGYLQGKRYLLVIDDIWDGEAWDYIHRALPDEKNGRAIIVTTRKEDVAKYVDSASSSYKIAHLDEENSWKLLRSKVLGSADEHIGEQLEKLGRKMLEKCFGLPLAITVLGGLLSRRPKEVAEWDNILKRIGYELHEREDSGSKNVRRILALSYDDLPYYLRSCFLYFGLFPEDSKIDAQKLIQLWVAEGFIQRRGQQTMEEVAADYLEELVDRSMIQVVERNSWGRVAMCRIHDLLLDLAISQGEEDKFLGHPAAATATARRVAIHRGRSISEFMPSSTRRASSSSPSRLLRSLLVFNIEEEATPSLQQVRMLVHNLKLLRVLDLQGADTITRLPEQIGALVHLRYLGLDDIEVRKLPSSVGKLRNLQTLRLAYNCVVPDVVWKIETLRHVVGVYLVTQGLTVHAKCCCKGELQTLWGLKAGRNWVGRRTLGEFTNLRALHIRGIVFSTHGALLSESLAELTCLNTLTLGFWRTPTVAQVETLLRAVANHRVLFGLGIYYSSESPREVRQPRPCLRRWCQAWCSSLDLPNKEGESDGEGQSLPPPPQFPPSLTRLQLDGIPLLSKPEDMSSLESLPNLKFLRLCRSAFTGKSLAFSAVRAFPKLQELRLHSLEELEEWPTICNGAMPCLKRLEIWRCPNLKALPEGLQHITTLRELEIGDMPEEFTQRIRRGDEGEDWYKVQHIPSIIIE